MLHLNDDINDELFRRAAEDYFLGAENGDWDSLLKKMNTVGDTSLQDTTFAKKRPPHRFMLLFHGTASIFRLFRRGPGKSKKKINIRLLEWRPCWPVAGWSFHPAYVSLNGYSKWTLAAYPA